LSAADQTVSFVSRIILVDDVSKDDTVADAGVDNEQRPGEVALRP
jgi:hypothetical protein